MIPKEYEKYEKVVTVAAVNFGVEWGNKAANLEKMKLKIREAVAIGVNMVCFPELALSGCECGTEGIKEGKSCAMHEETAETIPGPATEEIAKLAKELDVYVIFGMPERDAKDPKVKYVASAVVGPEGLLGSYRKLMVGLPERLPGGLVTQGYCFKTGNELPIFETKYGPIGVQICGDFWSFPEWSRILILKGARIIFNTTGCFFAPGMLDMMRNEAIGRAQSMDTYMVSSNFVGKERTLSYHGHSIIAGPGFPKWSKVLAEGEDAEEIVWATLSFETLAASRKVFQWTIDKANWNLMAKEYQQIAEKYSIRM